MDNKPQIAITGANGFFGSEIIRQALSVGYRIRGTDQHPKPSQEGVEYFKADIMDLKALKPFVSNVEIIIHSAGLAHSRYNSNHADFQRINELGTANIVRLACELSVKRLILISSVSVYGEVSHNVSESTKCKPLDAYAQSKLNAENEAIRVSQSGEKLQLVVLRFPTLYGKGDPGNVLRLIRTINRNQFVWIGDGSTLKSLLHKEDAARACLIAAQHPLQERVSFFNVTAEPVSLKHLVDTISMILCKKTPHMRISPRAALLVASLISSIPLLPEWRKGITLMIRKWLNETTYDYQKIRSVLGFIPQISLEQGLRQEIAWWQQNEKRRSH